MLFLADSLAKILARALNIAVVARMAEPFLFFLQKIGMAKCCMAGGHMV